MYLSKNLYDKKMKAVDKRNRSFLRKKQLNDAKLYKVKFPTTSKLVLLAVFILCVEIVLFSEYMMFTTKDTSAVYALIGVPTALVPIVMSYYHKSAKENTVGGIVYETAMLENSESAVG